MCVFDAAVHYTDYLLPGEPRHVLDVGAHDPRRVWAAVRCLAQEQPAILHTWRDSANFWGRMATARVPVPIVVTSTRNRALNPLNVLTERRFARRTARVLANSEGVRRELVSLAFVPADKIQIIHNFIDLDRFRPPDARRARPGAGPVEHRARRHRAAGPGTHQLAEAPAGRRAGAGGVAPARAAAGERAPAARRTALRSALRRAARSVVEACRACDDRVTHLGTVTDMVSLYQAADVAVLPSLWEGLPNAVLEALACGLPAVVSHAANIDGIVTEGAGFEVPTFAHAPLADALARITALSDDQRRAMGAVGRAHIADNFSTTRVLSEMVDLYARRCATPGRRADRAPPGARRGGARRR